MEKRKGRDFRTRKCWRWRIKGVASNTAKAKAKTLSTTNGGIDCKVRTSFPGATTFSITLPFFGGGGWSISGSRGARSIAPHVRISIVEFRLDRSMLFGARTLSSETSSIIEQSLMAPIPLIPFFLRLSSTAAENIRAKSFQSAGYARLLETNPESTMKMWSSMANICSNFYRFFFFFLFSLTKNYHFKNKNWKCKYVNKVNSRSKIIEWIFEAEFSLKSLAVY